MVKIQDLFRSLALGSCVSLPKRKIGKTGELYNVTGMRSKNGELAVLIHNIMVAKNWTTKMIE